MEENEKAKITREQLDAEKLRAEIVNLKSRWWIPPTIQATPAILLVILTGSIALFSGVLDAKRDYLSAMNERIANQTILLKAEERSQRNSLDLVKSELENTRSELRKFKEEALAISELRKIFPFAQIGYFGEEEGFNVDLTELDLSILGGPPEPILSKGIFEAVTELAKIQNLRVVAIRNVHLSEREVLQLGGLTSLRSIELDNNGLDDDAMKNFPTLPHLKKLRLTRQKFTCPRSLETYRNLQHISLSGTPVIDEGLRFLRYSNTSIEYLSLSKSSITDGSAFTLTVCPALKHLDIAGTKVTDKTVKELLDRNSQVVVSIGRSQISNDFAEEAKKGSGSSRVCLVD